jgi:hypothetical protein
MGGNFETIHAKTIEELKKKVDEWIQIAKSARLEDIRLGWDPKCIVNTEDGYKIDVWAHS